METVRKKEKNSRDFKKTPRMEMKNAFTGLIRRLDTAEERIPVFEVILLGKQREERQKMEQSM